MKNRMDSLMDAMQRLAVAKLFDMPTKDITDVQFEVSVRADMVRAHAMKIACDLLAQ